MRTHSTLHGLARLLAFPSILLLPLVPAPPAGASTSSYSRRGYKMAVLASFAEHGMRATLTVPSQRHLTGSETPTGWIMATVPYTDYTATG
ncbi:MAG: hypothetical protein M1435_04195 [Actinobacteria bacterium]|nr:hypothetical protein [Actinomycetota bacterium]